MVERINKPNRRLIWIKKMETLKDKELFMGGYDVYLTKDVKEAVLEFKSKIENAKKVGYQDLCKILPYLENRFNEIFGDFENK